MRDDAGLLKAVLTEPDQDKPRLAYAAWLRDRPRASAAQRARAELIRVQIDLEHLRDGDRSWPELARRERELLEAFQRAWEKPLRSLLVPGLRRPGAWLHARLFGRGGIWGFRRGFVEQVLATAAGFLQDDVRLSGVAPLRQAVLTNASAAVPALAADERLDGLRSLHLVSDAEFDEDMAFLAESARATGLTVLEMRFPRIDAELGGFVTAFHGAEEQATDARSLEDFPVWGRANDDERQRLGALLGSPRFVQQLTQPLRTSEPELLAANEWVYLGNALREAGAWAVAKTFHDLELDGGFCRRLVLFKPHKANPSTIKALRNSRYFHAEPSAV